MPKVDALHPDGHDLDRFLYASVGVDRNGADVTVLSALARVGCEPWGEAAQLARLGAEAACIRLKAHLVALKGVPALDLDAGPTATRLIPLLRENGARRVLNPADPTAPAEMPGLPAGWPRTVILVALALAMIYVFSQAG